MIQSNGMCSGVANDKDAQLRNAQLLAADPRSRLNPDTLMVSNGVANVGLEVLQFYGLQTANVATKFWMTGTIRFRCQDCGKEWNRMDSAHPFPTEESEEVEHLLDTGCKGRVERAR